MCKEQGAPPDEQRGEQQSEQQGEQQGKQPAEPQGTEEGRQQRGGRRRRRQQQQQVQWQGLWYKPVASSRFWLWVRGKHGRQQKQQVQ